MAAAVIGHDNAVGAERDRALGIPGMQDAFDHERPPPPLAQACKLFAQGGNRREEAHTLYRIAHAAFEEGDLDTARARLSESRTLAERIKHTRVIALCRERITRAQEDVDRIVADLAAEAAE